MAIINRIDPQQVAGRLAAWLAQRIPGADDVAVSGVTMPTDGASSETLLFDATWREGGEEGRRGLVARVEPAGERVLYSYDLEQEFRIMQALGTAGVVPVPGVVAFEADPSILGAPFLVMERIAGRVPPDRPPFTVEGWVLDLSEAQRATLHDNALRVLADIHRVEWKALGLDSLARAELGHDPLSRQITYYERAFEWGADGQRNLIVEATFDWVRANRPRQPEPIGLCWGDSRIGNMIFADDLSVAAVLDWELATLASPELDLGWWLFVTRHHSEGVGAKLPDGVPGREETIDRYQELSGRPGQHAHFYEVFAGLRFAVLMVRAGHLMIKLGALPAGHPMPLNNPSTQLLARMLDLPAPEGEATTFLRG